MTKFLRQFIFIATIIGILMVGGLVIYSATPGGKVKVNPILGHDLDLDALYYAQAATSTVHDITTQDISISAWVKVDVDAGDYNVVVNKRTVSTNWTGYSFLVWKTGGSYILRTILGISGVNYEIRGTTNIGDNKWHYVSAIIDRDTAANCKVFLDGVDNTASRVGTLSNVAGSVSTADIYTIGAQSDYIYKFDGQIRDVKLYYAAGDHWSDAQVLYQAQHPFDYTANAGTLTDYWRLDEGTGTTLYGYANNLTLSNALAWTTQPKIKMVKQENTTTTSNNPVGWWKFDETTAIHGSSLADSSGNGNTGTLSTGDGATNKSVAGKLGKGVQFDGVDDAVSVADNALLKPTTAATWSFWVKMDSLPDGYGTLISYQYSSSEYKGLFFTIRTSTNKFELRVGNGVAFSYCVSDIAPTTTWEHIVGIYDGSNLRMYRNGVLQISQPALTGGIVYSGSGNLTMGDSSVYEFPGSIDDVRIYNRALTASEVAQMYNSTKDGYLGNVKMTTGLVGYWKLDDNNALTSVTDYSGKGNTGTAYSGTATSTSVLSTSTAMVGRAMSFDGVDDWVSTTYDFSGLTKFTFSTWIKRSTVNALVYSTQYDSASKSVQIGAFSDGKVYITAGVATVYATFSTNDTAWHNITTVFDGSQSDNTSRLKAYLDGVQQNLTFVGTVGSAVPSGFVNRLDIGRNIGIPYYSNGLIDNVKIWNYARTAEQIKQDYERGVKGLP